MHRVHRLLAPRNRPFIIFLAVLAAVLIARAFYLGVIERRDLIRTAASMRHALADPEELTRLKMEQSTLGFQLPNLSARFPILGDPGLSTAWSNAAVNSQLDADVRQAWQVYLDHVAPLVQRRDPELEMFLMMQRGYDQEVRALASDHFLADKAGALERIRSGKFAALFVEPQYQRDRARFESQVAGLLDEETLALRTAYWVSEVKSVTNQNPDLAEYGRALLKSEAGSQEIRVRLEVLGERLQGLGELADAEQSPVAQPGSAHFSASSSTRLHFATFVPQARDFLTLEAATLLVGFLVTLPPELRYRRRLKIVGSMVLVYFILLTLSVPVSMAMGERHHSVFAFLGFLAPTVLLAAEIGRAHV